MLATTYAAYYDATWPTEAQVLLGITYTDGVTPFTGTLDPTGGVCDYPSPNDVRAGVSYGAGVGNVVIPDPSDVRLGVAYDTNSTVIGTYGGGSGDPGDVGWIG